MWLGLLMTRLLKLLGRGRTQIRGRELTTIAEIRGQGRWREEDSQAEVLSGYSFQTLFTYNMTKQYSFKRAEAVEQGAKSAKSS